VLRWNATPPVRSPRPAPGLGRPPFEAGRAGERATRNSSKSRGIVLDPFGGLGSTLIACEKTGRQARLIELDPRYCDVIVRRWQEWTSEVATLDGRPFEEVAAARATPEQAER
jgi:DNA modification methylase